MEHTILINHLKHGTTYLIGEGLDAQQGYNPPNRYMLEAARVLEAQSVMIHNQNQLIQELQIKLQQTVDQLTKVTKNDSVATE